MLFSGEDIVSTKYLVDNIRINDVIKWIWCKQRHKHHNGITTRRYKLRAVEILLGGIKGLVEQPLA